MCLRKAKAADIFLQMTTQCIKNIWHSQHMYAELIGIQMPKIL